MTPGTAMPRAPAEPAVSAVICTRDRAGRLRRTLESLCEQTLAGDAFEVIVVDDGSTDGTREVALGFEGRLRLRYSRQRSAGVASARNHGLLCSRGLIVVFVDDDLADPPLLQAHLDAHRRFPDLRYAVLGRARLDASTADEPLMQFVAASGRPPLGPAAPAPGERLDFRHVAAGRSSWKRSFLLDHGVFDPAFHAGGEGAELAHRLARRRLELILEPRASTCVAGPLSLDEACALSEVDGRARRLLARLHADPAVQRWAGIDRAGSGGRGMDGAYPVMLRSARDLERIVRMRLAAQLPVTDLERALLHRSYAAVLDASGARGLVDAGGANRV